MVLARSRTYLASAHDLSQAEHERLASVLRRLPERIIDAHTHIGRAIDVTGLPPAVEQHPVSTFAAYDLDDARASRKLLWPHNDITSLRMSHATSGFDHRAVNAYLLRESDGHADAVIGYGVPDDLEYTSSLIRDPAVCALKMYYRYREPPASAILSTFPAAVLDLCEERRLPIILHLPRLLPYGTDELLEVAVRWPDLPIVVAHVGGGGMQRLADWHRQTFERLAAATNLLMDTAWVADASLLGEALRAFGEERIIFGTDEPLSLIRAAVADTPRGPWLQAPAYHWHSDIAGGGPAEPEGLLHLQQIEAILEATGGDAEVLERVMHRNAVRVFGLRA